MTSELMIKKIGHYVLLFSSIVTYLVIQKQMDCYQSDIETLDQTRKYLVQKIEQDRQKKLLHEKVMVEFQQAQKLDLFSFGNPDYLTSLLEEIGDRSGLKKLDYQIKQVDKKQLNNSTLYWHKIIVEFEHDQDQTIFQFIETLSSKIPGLIIPEQLSLTRSDPSLFEKDLTSEVSGLYHFYLVTFDPPAHLSL